MKVLHICPNYLAANLYKKLFYALETMDIINSIFTLSSKNTSHHVNNTDNINVLNEEFSMIERLVYFKKQYIIYSNICKYYSLNEFDIVHAHTLFSAGFSAYLLHKKYGLPYIVAVRNTDVNIFFKYMFHLKGVGRTIMNNAEKIIFLSPAYRDFVIDKYVSKKNRQSILDKSLVIPNGIDQYFLENKYVVKRATDIKFIKLIYIGAISSNKNIETTIKVCKLLHQKGYSVNYTIIGEILNVRYKKILSKYSFINYHPKCPKEEVLMHLRDADLMVMPSKTETFGIVYAEAMSQGVPIIYSRGQGFDGQFEDGIVGYAVNCFDYKEIYERIIDVYNNYQQFSERCVSLVDKFNWLPIASQYKRLYG